MSKLPIFGGMLYDKNGVCPHKKIANTVQTIFDQAEPIRLTEMSRLRKLGESSSRACSCKQKACTCLWSFDVKDSNAHEGAKLQLKKSHRFGKRNNSNNSCSSSSNSSKHNCGNSYRGVCDQQQLNGRRAPQIFYKAKNSVLDRVRDGFRKYRKNLPEEKAPSSKSSMTWIIKPKRRMRVSKTSLVSKYNATAQKLAKINGVSPCLVRNASRCDLDSQTMTNLLKMATGTYKPVRATTLSSSLNTNAVIVPKSKKNSYNEKQRQLMEHDTETSDKSNRQRQAQTKCDKWLVDTTKDGTTRLDERLCQEPKCRLYKMERVDPSKIRVVKYHRSSNGQKPTAPNSSNAANSPPMSVSQLNLDTRNSKTVEKMTQVVPESQRSYHTTAQSSKSSAAPTPTPRPLLTTQISLVEEMGIDQLVKELTVNRNMAPQCTETVRLDGIASLTLRRFQQQQQLQKLQQQQCLQQQAETRTPPPAPKPAFYLQPLRSLSESPKLCKQPQIPRQKGGANLSEKAMVAVAAAIAKKSNAEERKTHGVRKVRKLSRRFKSTTRKSDRKTRPQPPCILNTCNSLSSELRESLTNFRRLKMVSSVSDIDLAMNKENCGETQVSVHCGKTIRNMLTVLNDGTIKPIRARISKPAAKGYRRGPRSKESANGANGDTWNTNSEVFRIFPKSDYTISFHSPVRLQEHCRIPTSSKI